MGLPCFVGIYDSPYFKKGTREMNDLIERLRLGDGTSAYHKLLLEAADALEALAQPEQGDKNDA